jgi:DNA modification methylase
MSFRIIPGDCLEVLKTLDSESVHTCITSPPYWGLRDYGTAQWEGGDAECDHSSAKIKTRADYPFSEASAKQVTSKGTMMHLYRDQCSCGATRIDKQIGLEKTPELFVSKMVEVFREVKRVLRDDGTLWLNLGDSYSGSGKGCMGDGTPSDRGDAKQGTNRGTTVGIFPKAETSFKPKDLCGIPWLVAFALRADGWYLRSDIIWHKPNPMPESVTDRPTKSHEYIFLLTKSPRYYYDAEAVKEEAICTPRPATSAWHEATKQGQLGQQKGGSLGFNRPENGRNKRSVWTVATAPFSGAHFATFPPKLIEPCILAGTSEQGCCSECGSPVERVTEVSYVQHRKAGEWCERGMDERGANRSAGYFKHGSATRVDTTKGWQPSCTCNAETQPCTVLDPFAGAGTSGLVARRLGRSFVGIELNPEYLNMAENRIVDDSPLFNTVETSNV